MLFIVRCQEQDPKWEKFDFLVLFGADQKIKTTESSQAKLHIVPKTDSEKRGGAHHDSNRLNQEICKTEESPNKNRAYSRLSPN